MVMVSNQTGIEVGILAGKYPGTVGHLFSPGAQRGPWEEVPYALDNGAWPAFKNKRTWDVDEWRLLLTWSALSGIKPLWVVVPDVVGDRTMTLSRWPQYEPVVRNFGFRPAFAVQDGMSFSDVPDDECMLFIGGSDEFKDAAMGPWCARFPNRVHVARVNGAERLYRAWNAGAVSVDGTGWFHKKGNQNNDLKKFIRESFEAVQPNRRISAQEETGGQGVGTVRRVQVEACRAGQVSMFGMPGFSTRKVPSQKEAEEGEDIRGGNCEEVP